jgi:hypothetical protein
VEIVPYHPEHVGQLLSFLRAQFPGSPLKGDRSFFHWRFARNPLGASLDTYLESASTHRAEADRIFVHVSPLVTGVGMTGPRSTAFWQS